MPTFGSSFSSKKTWKTMKTWERKRWYRSNAASIIITGKQLKRP